MVEIKTLKTDVAFFLVLVKISKRHTRDMGFPKRTIIMTNKDDHESCVSTQTCIAYILIVCKV